MTDLNAEITEIKVPSEESVNYILEEFCKLVPEFTYTYKIQSIQKIHDIDVKLIIHLRELSTTKIQYSPRFRIFSRYGKYGNDVNEGQNDLLYCSPILKTIELNHEGIRDILRVIHETLAVITIDNNRNRLCLPRYEGFGSTFLSGEECSICMENTTCKTNCGHSVCVVCWSRLQNKSISFPCPICRSIVEYKQDYRCNQLE